MKTAVVHKVHVPATEYPQGNAQGAVDLILRKLENGETITEEEQHLANRTVAGEHYKIVRDDMNQIAARRPQAVMFRQGDFDSIRYGVRAALSAAYALTSVGALKRRALEAEVKLLQARIVELEERHLVMRGTFDPSQTYRRLDVVALNGASFTAKRDNPGPCPGDGWQLSATRGKPGKPGPRVKALTIDGQGMLTLTNGDGSTVKCDLYPVLSKVQGSR